MNYKYFVVAIGRNGGLPPGGDDGKGSLAATDGDWSKGFKTIQGNFLPIGLILVDFGTEEEARAWVNHKGQDWLREKYQSIIIARTVA